MKSYALHGVNHMSHLPYECYSFDIFSQIESHYLQAEVTNPNKLLGTTF